MIVNEYIRIIRQKRIKEETPIIKQNPADVRKIREERRNILKNKQAKQTIK